MEYVSVFSTKDFYLGCALRTVGFLVLRVEFNSQGIATFIFSDPKKEANSVVAQFWNKELSGDLRTFAEAINELKSRIANKS